MKNKIFLSVFMCMGLFCIAPIAFASISNSIQPAADIVQIEAVHLQSALKVDNTGRFLESLHVGSTEPGVGGVFFINGTIVNSALDSDGQSTVPITIGDDMRVDGAISRLGIGGTHNLKFADTLMPEINQTYDLGTADRKWRNAYLTGSLQLGNYNPTMGAAAGSTPLGPAGTIVFDGESFLGSDGSAWIELGLSQSQSGDGINIIDNKIEVKVDDQTIEISSNPGELKLKDEGVDEAKLDAQNSPENGKYLSYDGNQFEWVDPNWTLQSGVLHSNGTWGIARQSDATTLYGNVATHINFGTDSTTGKSGENYSYATVSGGYGNVAGNPRSTVSGGYQNQVTAASSTISGGQNNVASNILATVGGGSGNTVDGLSSTIAGGSLNSATVLGATISGGTNNEASGLGATVGGGRRNQSTKADSTISGGVDNNATGFRSTVSGGIENTASSRESTVSGGYLNNASNYNATVSGGDKNYASGENSTIGGGSNNQASALRATVAGGRGNQANGNSSTIGGGLNNIAGTGSVIPGGRQLTVGNASFGFNGSNNPYNLQSSFGNNIFGIIDTNFMFNPRGSDQDFSIYGTSSSDPLVFVDASQSLVDIDFVLKLEPTPQADCPFSCTGAAEEGAIFYNQTEGEPCVCCNTAGYDWRGMVSGTSCNCGEE